MLIHGKLSTERNTERFAISSTRGMSGNAGSGITTARRLLGTVRKQFCADLVRFRLRLFNGAQCSTVAIHLHSIHCCYSLDLRLARRLNILYVLASCAI